MLAGSYVHNFFRKWPYFLPKSSPTKRPNGQLDVLLHLKPIDREKHILIIAGYAARIGSSLRSQLPLLVKEPCVQRWVEHLQPTSGQGGETLPKDRLRIPTVDEDHISQAGGEVFDVVDEEAVEALCQCLSVGEKLVGIVAVEE